MKIGFVVTFLSHGNPGSIVRIQEIARHLSRSGIETTILSPFTEDVENLSENSVKLIPTPITKTGVSSMAYRLGSKLVSIKKASRLVLSDSYIDRIVSLIRGGLYRVLKDTEFDVLHAVQPYAALACASLSKQFGIPLVTDLHTVWPEEALADSLLTSRHDKTFRRLHDTEQSILDFSDALTVVSDFLKSYVVREYSNTQKPIVVVPPAGPILPMNTHVRENTVVYAGLVHPREHVDLFAKSIPLVRSDAEFLISNHGEALSEIKKITNSPGYPAVNYVWFRKRSEVLELLMRSKIGVLPSRNDITRHLGPPLKLFDYMACGVPVVANDIGGWSEFIKNERIGLLTRDDPEEYAQAIDSILSDEDLWRTMHCNAIGLIKSDHNWQKIVDAKLVPLYERLLR